MALQAGVRLAAVATTEAAGAHVNAAAAEAASTVEAAQLATAAEGAAPETAVRT